MKTTTDEQRKRGHAKRRAGKPRFKLGDRVGSRIVICTEQRLRPRSKVDGIQHNTKDWFYLLQCDCGQSQWLRQSTVRRIITSEIMHCKYCSRNAQNPDGKKKKDEQRHPDKGMEREIEIRPFIDLWDRASAALKQEVENGAVG